MMHIQVVTFNLKAMTHPEFLKLCDELAANFANIPGLQSKAWVSDPTKNTYGGIYTWQDRGAMEAFMQSELFKAVADHPNFENISATDFGVLEGPTKVTHGWAAKAIV